MAAVAGLQPLQPSTTELVQWNQGRNNARMTYGSQLAQNNFAMNTAKNQYMSQLGQQEFANHNQRQGFDEPYIGRGMLHSGIRNTGLSNMYTTQANQLSNLQQQYQTAYGQGQLNNQQAYNNMNNQISNYDQLEKARRTDLAAQIKGII